MKKTLILLFVFLNSLIVCAQESSSGYNILKLPTSGHVAALGGENISLIENDAAIAWHNPALLANVQSQTLGLTFMTYFADAQWMGAQYVRAFGERHTGSLAIQYMNYGSQKEMNEAGQVLGDFSAKDIIFAPSYSYLLNDKWSGGATLKFAYSSYDSYSALALGVDLGLNYYDEERDLSASITLKNIGAEVSSFQDQEQHLPFVAQVGFSKGLNHLPLRISVTLTDLTRWSSRYYYIAEDEKEKLSFSKKLLNHFVVGADYFLTTNIYLSAGYNFRRAYELKAAGSAHGAGLSFGGGLTLSKFSLSASYAKYHKAQGSLMFNASYSW
ncbi:MAG: type IX secretion system protein PorQ [Bacteroidaceae bacterium]|nr:type IX secretion system protein PorQ [Bacteroidaceae bacterium]